MAQHHASAVPSVHPQASQRSQPQTALDWRDLAARGQQEETRADQRNSSSNKRSTALKTVRLVSSWISLCPRTLSARRKAAPWEVDDFDGPPVLGKDRPRRSLLHGLRLSLEAFA